MQSTLNGSLAVPAVSRCVVCRPRTHVHQRGRVCAMPIGDTACLGSAIKSAVTALPPFVPGIVGTLLLDAGNLLDLQPTFGGIIRLSVCPDHVDSGIM